MTICIKIIIEEVLFIRYLVARRNRARRGRYKSHEGDSAVYRQNAGANQSRRSAGRRFGDRGGRQQVQPENHVPAGTADGSQRVREAEGDRTNDGARGNPVVTMKIRTIENISSACV